MKNQELRQYKVKRLIFWWRFQNLQIGTYEFQITAVYVKVITLGNLAFIPVMLAFQNLWGLLFKDGHQNLWNVFNVLWSSKSLVCAREFAFEKQWKKLFAHSLLKMVVDQRREGLFGIKSAYDHSLRTDVPLRCLHWVVQTSASVIYVYLLMMNSLQHDQWPWPEWVKIIHHKSEWVIVKH